MSPPFFPAHRALALSGLLAFLLFPPLAEAVPRGGANTSFFLRSTAQENSLSGEENTLIEGVGRLDLFQDAPGYGRFFLSADGTALHPSDDEASLELSRFQVGIEGFSAAGRTSTLIAGDTAVRFTNLTEGFAGPFMSLWTVKPYLIPRYLPEGGRFLNTSYPELYLRGAALSSETEKDSLLLFGGRLANFQGFLANEIDLLDQDVYGMKWAYQWNRGSYAGFGVAHTPNMQRDGAKEAMANTVFLVDGSARLSPFAKVVAEVKGNVFREEGKKTSGWAVKAGPVVSWKKGYLEMNYRRVGKDFLFVREDLQSERDVEGVFAAMDYRPVESLALYSSFDWNRTNLDDDPDLSAVDTVSALAGGYWWVEGFPSVNLRVATTRRSSRSESATEVDSRSTSALLETAYRRGPLTPYLRLQAGVNKDDVSPDSSAQTASVTAGARIFRKTLSAYLEAEGQRRKVDSGDVGNGVRGRGGIAFSVSRLDLSADAEYGRETETPSDTVLETMSLSGRGLYLLPNRWTVSGDIRYALVRTQSTADNESSTLQFTVGLTKRFDWGSQGLAPVGSGTLSLLSEAGTIEGSVYQDLNRNGIHDLDEPGLKGIPVSLEDGTRAVTDSKGRYIFRSIPAGIHQVRVGERELPIDMNLLESPSRRTEVTTRDASIVDFPLLRSGSLRGSVLLDSNGDGAAGPGDTPFPDALVYLQNTSFNTFTDSDGVFALENLLPGEYLLRLDAANLPEDVKPLSATAQIVKIGSGAEMKDLTFLVGREQKQVIRKVFGKPK